MGVRGLISFCKEKQDDIVEQVDLAKIAKENGEIEILVDYYSFQQFLSEKFYTGLNKIKENPYLAILGGEYASLSAYVQKLVEDLKSLGILLVFFVDGSKGSSGDTARQKLDMWMHRHSQELQRVQEILNVCNNRKPVEELDSWSRPVLQEVQLIHTLKTCGCEVIQSPVGEADYVIALSLQTRPKAYAILSNDSDFCIFKGSKLIPYFMWDLKNELQLGSPSCYPEKPELLSVGVISSEKVMSALRFRSHHLLVELSIIAGNDFTGPVMQHGLQEKLDIRGHKGIENIAGWVNHYKNVENSPVIASEMRRNRMFQCAVFHSRQFYNMNLQPERPTKTGYIPQFIETKIKEGSYSPHIMGMHNNFYWHRVTVEDMSKGHPCVEIALEPLRSRIYKMVLSRHENMVNEYGRTPFEPMKIKGVVSADDDEIRLIHKIQPEKVFWNLKNFHHIMSHLERGKGENGQNKMWFDRYGRKNGFLVYLLRYFLLLNWKHNLHLTESEFLSLFALVFGNPSEQIYQSLKLKPTVRSVTIGNWFQELYRHAYLFLSKLLFISHEFPLPSEIFSGSAWTAYFMCCKDETFYSAVRQIPMEYLQRTQQEMNSTIREKRHMIRYVVEGVFHFDDRLWQ